MSKGEEVAQLKYMIRYIETLEMVKQDQTPNIILGEATKIGPRQ